MELHREEIDTFTLWWWKESRNVPHESVDWSSKSSNMLISSYSNYDVQLIWNMIYRSGTYWVPLNDLALTVAHAHDLLGIETDHQYRPLLHDLTSSHLQLKKGLAGNLVGGNRAVLTEKTHDHLWITARPYVKKKSIHSTACLNTKLSIVPKIIRLYSEF